MSTLPFTLPSLLIGGPLFPGRALPATLPFRLGGTPATAASLWFGPWFPDYAGPLAWFGPWFPDGVPDPTVILPPTPGGAATFLLLEAGSKLTLSYGEDSINQKMWSGAEYRESMLDDPKRTFVGQATLIDGGVRDVRAKLARFAAIGSTFLLGLPYEAISVSGPATGTTIPTSSTASSDWMQLGQRVALTDESGSDAVNAVIQGFTANSVTIDVDPGALGRVGCILMPTIPVFLDPQMTMVRSRGQLAVEQWQLNARAAVFGYPVSANYAFASLAAATGALALAVIRWAAIGSAGNAISITFVGDSALDGGNVTNVGNAYTFHFKPGVTTVFAMQIALDLGPAFFDFIGFFDPSAVLVAGDAIGPIALHGGADQGYGIMGAGATVATYDGRPLWDRRVQVQDTATDSIQSLAELVDLGGIPISIGTATQPDWGRALLVNRELGAEFQWLKAFLAAVRGCQRAFWLPSYRADLLAVSWTGTALIIKGPDDAFGGLTSWWPLQRDRIQIAQADGNIVYAQITAATDNGDGTMTLVCRNPPPPPITSPLQAKAVFAAGNLGVGGYVLSRTSLIGSAGNTGSIELRSDGIVSGLNNCQVTDDGIGNIVVHFHLGTCSATEMVFAVLFAYPFTFTWDSTTPYGGNLDATDVQGPIAFAGGQDVGQLGDLIELTGAAITRLSWLELCRFDSPTFEITFDQHGRFSMPTTARVVQQ